MPEVNLLGCLLDLQVVFGVMLARIVYVAKLIRQLSRLLGFLELHRSLCSRNNLAHTQRKGRVRRYPVRFQQTKHLQKPAIQSSLKHFRD